MAGENNISIGEKIKADMKARGLKATVIAKKMNVSRQSINQIDERKKFDIEFLLKFKEASGLDYTQYAYENYVKTVVDEPTSVFAMESKITLNLGIVCRRSAVARFSEFLSEMDVVARKYGYELI